MKTLLLSLLAISFVLSCTNHSSENNTITEEPEVLADTAYFGDYHYVANLDELGETHLYFTFGDYGMEGKALSKDKNQAFRIDPVMHIAGYANLKLIKSQTTTNDLTYYDYLFNFQYKYLGAYSIKTNFYSNYTDGRTDVIIKKVE